MSRICGRSEHEFAAWCDCNSPRLRWIVRSSTSVISRCGLPRATSRCRPPTASPSRTNPVFLHLDGVPVEPTDACVGFGESLWPDGWPPGLCSRGGQARRAMPVRALSTRSSKGAAPPVWDPPHRNIFPKVSPPDKRAVEPHFGGDLRYASLRLSPASRWPRRPAAPWPSPPT